jgi:two-component system cell cycle response regulator DivK
MSVPTAPPRRPPSGTRARGPLVLLVEDDDATRELYAAELAAAGFMVLEAADGPSGVEKALRFGPHAVVLDMMLPGLDGFKVASRLRGEDRTQSVVIIALTALMSTRFHQLALGAGCDAFLSKPIAPVALIGELVRLLARRTPRASGPDLSRLRGR